MKEPVTKVNDMLTQEDLHGAFHKLLERYNKCIAPGGEYFEGDLSFMCVLSIKVAIRKKSENLFNDPHMLCLCDASCMPSNNLRMINNHPKSCLLFPIFQIRNI